LDGDDFLDGLAGKQVFRLAQNSSMLFRLLSRWLGLLARYAPRALFRMFFASARGADTLLATDAAFKEMMYSVFNQSFRTGQSGYQREVLHYAQPWAATLADIHTPVHIWHGDADNWSSPAMAHYLHKALPIAASLTMLDGLSHYSCLISALPGIVAMVAQRRHGLD
jgi:pimeloyl-ACP methyl ester carboxylesterase